MPTHQHDHAVETESSAAEVLDPVCGMMILPEDAAGTAEHKGQTYHFCSTGCVAKFKSDPEKYLSPCQARADHEERREC